MKSYKSKTVLVYDNGLFAELAVTLAKDFGRVLYFCPWTNAYPKSNSLLIGHGIDGVERVSEPWSYIDKVDLFVFPDVYEAGLQEYLVKAGKRVWGCRSGADLELDRVWSKEECVRLGIDIGPYDVVDGLADLRRFLKRNNDRHVKISATRGDMETWHSPNYQQSELVLDELEHSLGAKKKVMEFIVEKGINNALEIGYDGYVIDGKFPKAAMVGAEIKDKAYVGKTMPYSQLPDAVRGVNQKLSPYLKKVGMRGFISTEVRATEDGKAYLIDPTMRMPAPPGELYQAMVGNLADILWHGADGIVIEPEYEAKWGAELILVSSWAEKEWQPVSFPDAIRDHVKLRNFTMINGQYFIVPQWSPLSQIGAVVATGDTPAAAIAECKKLAEQVKGNDIHTPVEALDEALETLQDMLEANGEGEKAPPSKLSRKADDLLRRGLISEKAYGRMVDSA